MVEMTQEELVELGKVAILLLQDVEQKLSYDTQRVRVNFTPILPLSLAHHYNHILTPHKPTIEKLLKFLEQKPIS